MHLNVLLHKRFADFVGTRGSAQSVGSGKAGPDLLWTKVTLLGDEGKAGDVSGLPRLW